MSDSIVYRFPEMKSAASDVSDYANQYKTAADTLRDSLLTAVANWEGESKEKFMSFLQGAVYEHIHTIIPQLVDVVSKQIEMSSDNMANTDAEIAYNIPQSLSG